MATGPKLKVAAIVFLIVLVFCDATHNQGSTFGIDYDNNTFVKDGKPFRYISGSIHYSRVPYQYWDDRLRKMAAAGLNAIQTYVPWNIHEPSPSQYDFTGQQDIVTFLQTAQKYNLSVILRPGPYICAEWEFGGLPAWILTKPGIQVRTMDQKYIEPVDSWLSQLYTVVKPLLYINGGPIITVQIENEYGSYPACDHEYLGFLRTKAISILGNGVTLFTTDGDGDGYFKCGTLPNVYATVDFGVTNHPAKNFAIQRHKEPKGPLVNSEFYTGWLDHWGEKHSTVNTAAVTKTLDLMLDLGANVNMYMFEGGTNFGFWNGANDPYQPVPTSYDYDAPLTEAGDITDKYLELRQIISKYNPLPKMKIPPSTPKSKYGQVQMSYVETIQTYVKGSEGVTADYPMNMESLGHYYGFVLYQHNLKCDVENEVLNLTGVRDRGYISFYSSFSQIAIGVVERGKVPVNVTISGKTGDILYILVENQGRIGYGGHMNDNNKGLISNVTLNGDILKTWVHFPIKFDDDKIMNKPGWIKHPPTSSSSSHLDIPAIFQGTLSISEEPMDTYLDMNLWTKGQIFINGKNLGRYWPHVGPQVRLYVPKYALKKGDNNVVLFELERSPCVDRSLCYVEFKDQPLINATISSHSNLSNHSPPDKTGSYSVTSAILDFIKSCNIFKSFWGLLLG